MFNPILAGFHPDPSIAVHNGVFYIVTSSFSYFPGLPLYASDDLQTWRFVRNVLDRPSQLRTGRVNPSEGIYAPTIRSFGDELWISTTNVEWGGNFAVHAADAEGSWSDPVWLEQTGIDPGLVIDDAGRVFLATTATGGGVAADPMRTAQGVVLSEIDLASGRRLSPIEDLTSGWVGQFPEGPRFLRRDGWWYLLLAEGGTEAGHMATIGRSRDIRGPFQGCPRNPVLTHRSTDHPLQAVGHADIVEAPDGRWWGVSLCTRPSGHPAAHTLGRETVLFPVVWDEDGWPILGDDGIVPVQLPPTEDSPTQATGALSRPAGVGGGWVSLGTPEPDEISARAQPGQALLTPPAGELSRLLHRQDAHAFELSATIVASGSGRAGVTAFMDPGHCYDLALIDGGSTLRCEAVVEPFGDVVDLSWDGRPATVVIRGDQASYRLLVRLESEEDTLLAEWPALFLSSEVAGGFTGVMVGVFADGDEAEFAEIAYQAL